MRRANLPLFTIGFLALCNVAFLLHTLYSPLDHAPAQPVSDMIVIKFVAFITVVIWVLGGWWVWKNWKW